MTVASSADQHVTAPIRTDLTGLVGVVTGATGDMGSAFAYGLADAGADLVLTARSPGPLQEVADDISAKTGRKVEVRPADLADRAEATRLADAAWEAFGRVDVVVNNAVPTGSQVMVGDLLSTPDELWTRWQEPIVWGPLALAKRLVPRMADLGGGAFVNIVSATGLKATPGFDAYGLAKGNLVLLTKYMAREWGRWNIRANAVSPGLITNPHAEATNNEITRRTGLLDRTALGRKGTKYEVVGVVTFLASPAASFISGELVAVNGGRF